MALRLTLGLHGVVVRFARLMRPVIGGRGRAWYAAVRRFFYGHI